MNGGGGGRGGERDGDVGPSPPPATNSGGQFLLQLLQKPQQSQTHEQPSPTPQPPSNNNNNNNPNSASSTYPHHHPDPAVAAVGHTVPYPPWPSNGHDPHPPPWSAPPSNSPFPHNFLLPGFPSNPWSPTGGFPPPPSSHFPVNPPVLPHELYRLGLLGNNSVTGNPGGHHHHQQEQQKHHPPQLQHQQQQQQQQQESMLMFGSLACDLRNQEGLLNRNSLDPHSRGVDRVNAKPQFGVQKDREVLGFNANTNGMLRGESDHFTNLDRSHQGSHHLHDHQGRGRGGDGWGRGFQRSPMPEPRRAPPGFPQKPKSLGQLGAMSGRSEFDHNVGYPGEFDRPEYHQIQGDLSARLGLSGHVDHPGPPSGTNLHSVPAMDIEESRSKKMHREVVEQDNPGLVAKRQENKSRDGHSHRRGVEREQDDLEAHFMSSMVLRDGVDNTNGMRQHNNSHDKDFKRLWTPPQRIKNHRRESECRSDIDRLNAPFLAVYESLVPAEEEKAKQKQLLTSLEKLVNKEWPSALLYLYGSCANSFGVSKSDIDVCLAIEETDITKSEILLKLAELLESDNLKNVQALTRARVPIVKLMDPVTGISCDICINNVLAVVNTKLLRDYAQIDVRLRQLAFIVKHWAKSRGVNETYRGTLSSYAYVLMCIHFLQQRKPAILPCLQEMETTYAVTVDGIECAFFDKVENLRDFGARNKENIGQLVWGFFDYWAHRHDYANSVISVRTGGMISKRAKDWTRRIGNDRHLICIEDPFQISHDLGRVVDKFSIKVLREEFERAANVMQYDPDPCITLFEPYVPR